MTVKILRDVQGFVGVLDPWHRDNWSENLGGLRSKDGLCRGEHLLIMMNLVAGGRCLHIEPIVLRNLFAHMG